jgi:Fe-S cluster assembly protein SufD
MTTTATNEPELAPGFTQEAFDAFLRARNEPSWLTELRREAWGAFQELSLPDMRQEEWRRTDLRLFRLERFGLPAPAAEGTPLPEGLLSAGVDLAGQAVTLDTRPLCRADVPSTLHVGRITNPSYAAASPSCTTWLDPLLAARGVLFGPLDVLAAEHGELVQKHLFTRAVDPRADKFAALHAACWSGGTLLYVPRGVVIDRPLHMLSALSDGGVDLSHTLIVLEEGAEATLLAETASTAPTAAGLHCGAIEIFVGPGARLRYVNLQDWGSGVWHFAHQKAVVGRAAQLQWTIGALGARLAKVNQHVSLVGEEADAQVNGVMFTEGRQHLSYHTLQHHEVPRCRSDLLYKGALQDRSHLVWRGMIRVDRDAQKTDGYQRNDNLMLSETARADSIPGLEILADDVKCSHGATAGRVDDEMIFYAQARGLTRKEAVRMIVAGFFQQVFDRITIESVRHALGEAIGRRIREYE